MKASSGSFDLTSFVGLFFSCINKYNNPFRAAALPNAFDGHQVAAKEASNAAVGEGAGWAGVVVQL